MPEFHNMLEKAQDMGVLSYILGLKMALRSRMLCVSAVLATKTEKRAGLNMYALTAITVAPILYTVAACIAVMVWGLGQKG